MATTPVAEPVAPVVHAKPFVPPVPVAPESLARETHKLVQVLVNELNAVLRHTVSHMALPQTQRALNLLELKLPPVKKP
jgi:hypothetical protein